MKARLLRRIRETGTENIANYLLLLNSCDGTKEHPHLISALTTNYTNFFREPHHFNLLTEKILPDLDSRGAKNISIWSAGCSSGQEPISIAISILDQSRKILSNIKIIGTDIDRDILKKASTFTYSDQEISGIPQHTLTRHFTRNENNYTAAPHIQNAIRYQELNLNSHQNPPEAHDIIFCRNVAIYFTPETQTSLWERVIGSLKNEGFLLIGHSERIPDELRDRVRQFGPNSYQKTGR